MVDNMMTDAELVKNYVKGRERALSILIERHESRIYGFIYSKVLDRAVSEDIFQDTFIKVIKNLKMHSYNEEGKFLPWVMRIAHNLVVDHFRKTKKMSICRDTDDFSIFSIMVDNSPNVESQIINTQSENDLQRLIEELPESQKEVLVMRVYQNLSFKEISGLTGISVNTALGRMRYALINLRKVIDKYNLALVG